MISHLRGTLLEKHPNQVIVDVQGVGYEVTIPVSAFSSLPAKGEPVQLHNPPRVARLCYTRGCSPRDGQLGLQNAAIP